MTALVGGANVAESGDQRSLNELMLRELREVVRWNPQHARAHLRLAAKCIAQFEILQQTANNAMGLAQVRDAAIASGFASRDELHAWLGRAFGENIRWLERAAVEARIAASLSPLQGEAYVYLAQLSFLETAQSPARTGQLIDQALLARPYDADVLFEVGRQELLTGDLAAALDRWKRCFGHSGPHQRKIVYLLAGRIPATMFLTSLQPDWRTLREIWKRYLDARQSDDIEAVLAYAVAAAERETQGKSEIPPAHIWFWQSQFHNDVGRGPDALACLERAFACNPNPYFIRFALARSLASAGRYAEAEPHYRWCLARRPADKNLANALVTISKQRLAQRQPTSSHLDSSSPRLRTVAAPPTSSSGSPSTQQ
jgi:tetratricopeptide (TPR) repeat protein